MANAIGGPLHALLGYRAKSVNHVALLCHYTSMGSTRAQEYEEWSSTTNLVQELDFLF